MRTLNGDETTWVAGGRFSIYTPLDKGQVLAVSEASQRLAQFRALVPTVRQDERQARLLARALLLR